MVRLIIDLSFGSFTAGWFLSLKGLFRGLAGGGRGGVGPFGGFGDLGGLGMGSRAGVERDEGYGIGFGGEIVGDS